MPVVDVSSLVFERFTLRDADFSAGRDDDTSLSAGVVGEIATAEVGEDGQLSNYDAVRLGQPASNPTGDRKGNEQYVKLRAGSSDIADAATFAFAARKKGEIGGGTGGMVTGFRKHRGQDNADPAQRDPLPPQNPVVKDGRVLQLLAKDEANSLTVDLSESTFELPSLGGQ
jgi:hypothetical protein